MPMHLKLNANQNHFNQTVVLNLVQNLIQHNNEILKRVQDDKILTNQRKL